MKYKKDQILKAGDDSKPANAKAASTYKKTNIASSTNWNVENLAMNNIAHTYPANSPLITQTQTRASCMYNCSQYAGQQTHVPEKTVYYVDQGASTEQQFPNQYLHQTYNYTVYNAQPQYETQMQYPQAENTDYAQRSSCMDSEKNAYECQFNLDNYVQEQSMAMLDVNNYTHATTCYKPNSIATNASLEEVIRSSLSDLTDLINL
jgi:hypothetical protein